MKAIHDALAANSYPNYRTLARSLELSRRTIARDMDHMRDFYRLPIEFSGKKNGFYYSQAVSSFLGMASVTEAELFYFLVAQKAVAPYHGTGLEEPLARACDKLVALLDSKHRFTVQNFHAALSFRPFAPEAVDPVAFQTIKDAIDQCHSLKFIYRKPGEKCSSLRHIHPYHVINGDGRWYMIGWDVQREAIRQFAIGRMSDLAVQYDRFQPRPDFNLCEHLRGSLTVLTGDGDYEVVIEFDAWATDILRGRTWHASQEITEMPGGGSHLRLKLSALEEVERWILSWGVHATVMRPECLAKRIRKTAEELAKRYQPQIDQEQEETGLGRAIMTNCGL